MHLTRLHGADRRPKWPPRPRLAPLLWRPRLWLLLRLPGLWFDVKSLTHDLLKLSLAQTLIVRRRVLPVIGTLPVGALCRKPVRAPLPAHLPRERVVVPAPCSRPRCGGKLAKLGEDITETLEVIPRQRKVIQTVLAGPPPSRRRRSIRSPAGEPAPACWR